MKKIITPILNAAFLIPLLIIAMGSIELMVQSFGLSSDYIRVFEVPYVFLTIGIIVISGIPLFWFANRLMQRIEKLRRPTIYDHFRQSIFFYFIIVYSLSTWIFSDFNANVDNLYFLTLSAFSIVSIMINYILFQKRKANIT